MFSCDNCCNIWLNRVLSIVISFGTLYLHLLIEKINSILFQGSASFHLKNHVIMGRCWWPSYKFQSVPNFNVIRDLSIDQLHQVINWNILTGKQNHSKSHEHLQINSTWLVDRMLCSDTSPTGRHRVLSPPPGPAYAAARPGTGSIQPRRRCQRGASTRYPGPPLWSLSFPRTALPDVRNAVHPGLPPGAGWTARRKY